MLMTQKTHLEGTSFVMHVYSTYKVILPALIIPCLLGEFLRYSDFFYC